MISPMARHHTTPSIGQAFASRQGGAAVLVAMLVVAIAAVAASGFMFRTRVEWRRLDNLTHVDEAHRILRAAQQWGAAVLLEDSLHSSVDYLGAVWATRLPPVEAEGYQLSGWMEDQERRFNLNNLVLNGRVDNQQLAIFLRLLNTLHLSPDLAFAVADWIDTDNIPLNPSSAESPYYESLPTPYQAANHPLMNVNELLSVKGFDRNVLAILRPYVTALPTRTPINVNTASPEVLTALVGGLSLQQAYTLAAKRDRIYYRNVQDFMQALPTGATAVAALASVTSQYFLVRARVRQDRLAVGSVALYHRAGAKLPSLVWRAEL